MKNLFVPFEIAEKLKEKNFDKPCFALYYKQFKSSIKLFQCKNYNEINEYDTCTNLELFKFKNHQLYAAAPLYQQVIDWFREKHNLYIIEQLDRTAEPKYCYEIWKYKDFGNWALVSKRPEFFLHYTSIDNLNDVFVEALTLI